MNTRFFKDKHGKVVLGQAANPPIVGWAVLTLANFFVHSSRIEWLAGALLFTWAFMEIYQGVNYFRRLLGLVVLVYLLMTHLS